MAKRKQLIKVGDTVVINTPQMFESVGYDYTIVEAMAEMAQNQEMVDLSIKATNLIRNSTPNEITTLFWSNEDHRLQYDILQAMAYRHLSSKKKEGMERKLFESDTLYYVEMKDHIWKVEKISKIMTGKYQPSSISHDSWNNENDYEPAALIDRKFHRVLHLSLYVKSEIDPSIFVPKTCKIRDIFCSKVNGG